MITRNQINYTLETKNSMQIYLFLKKLLLSKFPSENIFNYVSLLYALELNEKANIITKVLKETEQSKLYHISFLKLLLEDEYLRNCIFNAKDFESVGFLWKESLLNRQMSLKLKDEILSLTQWKVNNSISKLNTLKNINSQNSTNSNDENITQITKTRRLRKKSVGFDEILFTKDESESIAHPSVFRSDEWKYYTQKERKQLDLTILRNQQKFTFKEEKIVQLINKQRKLSKEMYKLLDEKTQQELTNLDDFHTLENVFNYILNIYKSTTQIGSSIEFDNSKSLDISLLTQSEKQIYQESILRIIFIWIVYHIDIDISQDDDEGETSQEILSNFIAYSSKGIAQLFKDLCTLASIECKIVKGTFRDPLLPYPNCIKNNHFWNICKIGANYRLVDSTWPYEYGFFMNPNEFIQSHLPSISEYQNSLLPKELVPQNIDSWMIKYPSYSTSSLSIKMIVLHENHEAYENILSNTKTNLKIQNISIDNLKARILQVNSNNEHVEIYGAYSFEETDENVNLHIMFPGSGHYLVEILVPKSEDILNYETHKFNKKNKELEAKKQKDQEEQERLRKQEESIKGKNASKASTKSVPIPDIQPISIINDSKISHTIATIRSFIVSETSVPTEIGYPMTYLKKEFFPLSHLRSNIIFNDKSDNLALNIRFLTKQPLQLPTLNLSPIKLEIEDTSGKKGADKKTKGITSEDLQKLVIEQECPLQIASQDFFSKYGEEINENSPNQSLGYSISVDEELRSILKQTNMDSSQYFCQEFIIYLPAEISGGHFSIEWSFPKLKYNVTVESTIIPTQPKLIVPKLFESDVKNNVYVPLPFSWKFQIINTELSQSFIDGKKPIDCTLENGFWKIPEQKKGTFKIIGTINGIYVDIFEFTV